MREERRVDDRIVLSYRVLLLAAAIATRQR
jgi:hypothetical protein